MDHSTAIKSKSLSKLPSFQLQSTGEETCPRTTRICQRLPALPSPSPIHGKRSEGVAASTPCRMNRRMNRAKWAFRSEKDGSNEVYMLAQYETVSARVFWKCVSLLPF